MRAKKTEAGEQHLYTVSWYECVWAKTEAEARAKAVRKFKKEGCMVTKSKGLPPAPDPDTHCRHGMLWSTNCDYC